MHAPRSGLLLSTCVRALALWAGACAELRPDRGGVAELSDSGTSTPIPADAGVAPIDATRCEDPIGGQIQDLVLTAELVPGEACALRFRKPLEFSPWRLAVQVDGFQLVPNFAQSSGAPEYGIEGDVIRITGPVCERLRRDGGPAAFISLRYGACRIWE